MVVARIVVRLAALPETGKLQERPLTEKKLDLIIELFLLVSSFWLAAEIQC